MPRNTNTGTLVYVSMLYGAGTLKYGFRSRLRDTLRDDFGQTLIANGISIAGLVIGANSPKPARASIRTTGGYEGSFCSSANVAALRADGYSITRSKPSKIKQGAFADTFYATVNGMKIAFVTNAVGSIGAAEAGFPNAQGVTLATSADRGELIYSPEFPRLPKFDFLLANGKTFGSLCDPSKADSLAETGAYKEGYAGLYTAGHFTEYYQISAT